MFIGSMDEKQMILILLKVKNFVSVLEIKSVQLKQRRLQIVERERNQSKSFSHSDPRPP